MRLYSAGLVSLLCACSPRMSMIYMDSETSSLNSTTYAISDHDNRIKREVLEAEKEGDEKLPWNIRQKLMLEADGRGLFVRTNELDDRTEITVFFPIIYSSREWLAGYSADGYFYKGIELYDDGKDGTIDGLSEPDRLRFKNIIKASERVLRSKRKP